MTLDGLTAAEVVRRVTSREVSAEEVTRACLDRITERDRGLDAFLEVTPERALGSARRVDAGLAAGQDGLPLAIARAGGVEPIALVAEKIVEPANRAAGVLQKAQVAGHAP